MPFGEARSPPSRFPAATARPGDAAPVQGGGDLAKGLRACGRASAMTASDGGMRVRSCLVGGVGDGAARVAEGLSTGLGG